MNDFLSLTVRETITDSTKVCWLLFIQQAEVYAEIGEVIMGTKEAKREETTIFKSLGKVFFGTLYSPSDFVLHLQTDHFCECASHEPESLLGY